MRSVPIHMKSNRKLLYTISHNLLRWQITFLKQCSKNKNRNSTKDVCSAESSKIWFLSKMLIFFFLSWIEERKTRLKQKHHDVVILIYKTTILSGIIFKIFILKIIDARCLKNALLEVEAIPMVWFLKFWTLKREDENCNFSVFKHVKLTCSLKS